MSIAKTKLKLLSIAFFILCASLLFGSQNVFAEDPEVKIVESYSYEIIPLMKPFNEYLYIKTNNMDPTSFRFVDTKSKYSNDEVILSYDKTNYADVIYEDASIARVKGGYLVHSGSTDGGTLKLQASVKLNYSYFKSTIWVDTSRTITIPALVDEADYLINTYDPGKKTNFFDRLTAIEQGFSKICLYRGASVLGKLNKSETAPYYGISSSPHKDQSLYIQTPYYRSDRRSLLASSIYPYRYDSLGYPSMISTIALRIQSDAAVHWDSYYHDTVIITYNGETKSYGGQGQGGGQAVAENQILKYYKFDNSTNDEAAAISLKNSKQLLLDYGKLEVYKEEEHVPDLLTWKDVQNTVGKEGAHIQIVRLGSSSGYGPAGIGYSYIYDDGYTYYSDSNGFYGTAVSDAWFGGRYYNDNECFEYGASFEEHSTADIYIKDPVIPVPEECVYYYGPTEDNNRSYRLLDFSTYTGYDAATGVWKGVFKFTYYSSTDTWEAEVISQACRGKNGAFVSDNTFIEAYTLTREEVLALGIDSNKDRYPDTYYTYNKLTPPGTLISVGTRYDDPDTGRSYLAGDNGEFEEILLEIKEDEVELKTKDTYELDHTISLPDSWGKAKWSSSDPSVASVDQNGKITAIRFGKATITASSENGECQDSCEVTVRFYDAVEGVVNGSNRITANISSAINWMAESEITKGYDGKYFGSFKETSRADFVIFLWRFAGKPEADETNIKTFNDIEGVYAPTSATYQAISWAASTGIINGYSDGSFKPKNSVSRGQVAIMLWKYAGQPEIVKPYTAFPDVTVNKKTGITANTVTAINWAQSEGIVKGYGSGAYKGTFQPLGSCLRFQMSIILWRYADMMQTLPKTGEKTGAGKIETDEEEIAEDIEVSEEVISLSEADEDIPISEEDSVEIEFEAAEEVETESDAESDAEEESDITIAESED